MIQLMIIYDGQKRDKKIHLQQSHMLHVTGKFTPHFVPTFMQNVYSSSKYSRPIWSTWAMKQTQGLFRVYKGWNYSIQFYRDYHKPLYIRIPNKQPVFHGKYPSIKNWMGPYQRTPKEVARAIRCSGLGVRSVGPVGDFLESGTPFFFFRGWILENPIHRCLRRCRHETFLQAVGA